MESRFNCNLCTSDLNLNNGSLTSCGHFLCNECLDNPTKCSYCEKKCKITSLKNNLPKSVLNYLNPEPIQSAIKMLEVAEFQNNQKNEVISQMKQVIIGIEQKMDTLEKINGELKIENKALKMKLKKLEPSSQYLTQPPLINQNNRDEFSSFNKEFKRNMTTRMKKANQSRKKSLDSFDFFSSESPTNSNLLNSKNYERNSPTTVNMQKPKSPKYFNPQKAKIEIANFSPKTAFALKKAPDLSAIQTQHLILQNQDHQNNLQSPFSTFGRKKVKVVKEKKNKKFRRINLGINDSTEPPKKKQKTEKTGNK